MTDEQLIEEAKAGLAAFDAYWGHGGPVAAAYGRPWEIIRRLLAVFERAHTPTDDEREALIEKATLAMIERYAEPPHGEWSWSDMARAALAVFEKAHTPSDDEREALARAIDPIGYTGAFAGRAADRALAAGFRRSEVPEPSAEDAFAPGECTGAGDCDAPIHVHGCYRPHRADQCDAPEEYGHLPGEPQGEPSDAQIGLPGNPGVTYDDIGGM